MLGVFVFHAGVTGYFAGEEEGWPCFSKTRMTNGVLSPRDCSPCILSPLWQEGRSLLGLRVWAAPPPVSCLWGCHGSRGQVAGKSIGCQRKGSLEGNKSRNQGGENAIPTHVLCVSANRHYYLDYKSSKALLMEAFSDFITMKTRGQNGW